MNTTPEGTSNPTQESMYEPSPEGSSNPTPEGLSLNDSTHDGQDAADSTQPPTKKPKSEVWNDFDKVKVNGEVKAVCKWCKKHLSGNSTYGTTHLRGHANRCIQKLIKTRGHNKGQTFIMPKAIQGKQEIGFGNYDAEKTKKLIENAIVMHDYPLSIVDHIGFRRILGSLQPLFLVPSRNTIKKEILKIYDIERQCTMKMLDTHEGRVAITTDMWTASNQKKGYMAVTVHYIDGTWTLQSRILR